MSSKRAQHTPPLRTKFSYLRERHQCVPQALYRDVVAVLDGVPGVHMSSNQPIVRVYRVLGSTRKCSSGSPWQDGQKFELHLQGPEA